MDTIICLIAIYNRHQIVKLNVELLKKQTIPIKIILIVSTIKDKKLAECLNVDYIFANNQPLGLKWQQGLEYCKKYNPQAIIINGSDDLLTANYCESIYKYILDGYDQVGLNNWYIYDTANKKTFLSSYVDKNLMIGCGRIVSRKILDKIRWSYFPINKSTGLDGYSLKQVKDCGGKIKILNASSFYPISVKGPWEQINPINNYLKNKKLAVKELFDTSIMIVDLLGKMVFNQNTIKKFKSNISKTFSIHNLKFKNNGCSITKSQNKLIISFDKNYKTPSIMIKNLNLKNNNIYEIKFNMTTNCQMCVWLFDQINKIHYNRQYIDSNNKVILNTNNHKKSIFYLYLAKINPQPDNCIHLKNLTIKYMKNDKNKIIID